MEKGRRKVTPEVLSIVLSGKAPNEQVNDKIRLRRDKLARDMSNDHQFYLFCYSLAGNDQKIIDREIKKYYTNNKSKK